MSFDDGDALEVRLEAAAKQLDDEREREAGLMTRAIGAGAAVLVLLTLMLRALESAVSADHPRALHAALVACAIAVVSSATRALWCIVFGVLDPTERNTTATAELESWLEDERMGDSEQAARYAHLADLIAAIKSRRLVSARKALRLRSAYRALAVMVVVAAGPALTLVL